MTPILIVTNLILFQVDKWLDAHEKYFRVLTPMQEVPSRVEYRSEPLPFITNNTQTAYAVLQYAMPNAAPPKAQTNSNAAQTDAIESKREQRSTLEPMAAQAQMQSHVMGPNAMQPKAVRPNGVRSNPVQPYLNRPYAAVTPYAVQSPNAVQSPFRLKSAQPHSTQQAGFPESEQPNAVMPNSKQQNAMRPNPVQPIMYTARPDLAVQPPHRISPLKWKKTVYVHNF